MTRLYCEVIDRMLAEFDGRFTSTVVCCVHCKLLMPVVTHSCHYRVLVDKLLVHSQTVSAGAYLRAKFPNGNERFFSCLKRVQTYL